MRRQTNRTVMSSTMDTALLPFSSRFDNQQVKTGATTHGILSSFDKVIVRRETHLSRKRTYYLIDVIRVMAKSPSEAWAIMMARVSPTDTLVSSSINCTDKDSIMSMIALRGQVVCPWPREAGQFQQHQPVENFELNLRFGLSGAERFSNLFKLSKMIDNGGVSTRCIELKANADVIRKLVSLDAVSEARWNSNSSYHIMPVSVVSKRIECNFDGAVKWQMSFVSQLPTQRRQHKDVEYHKETRSYTPTAFVGPSRSITVDGVDECESSAQFIQENPVERCGSSDIKPFRLVNDTLYSSVDFSRWINVSYVRLHTELGCIRDSVASKDATSKSPRSVGGGFSALCCIEVPTNWEQLYTADAMSIQYIVLTEMKALIVLHNTSNQNAARLSHNQHTHVEQFVSVAETSSSPKYIIVPFDVIRLYLIERQTVYDAEKYMMRLDNMSILLSPVNGEKGWDQFKSVCDFKKATYGESPTCDNSFADFFVDVEIVYEPCTAFVDVDDATTSRPGHRYGISSSQSSSMFTSS